MIIFGTDFGTRKLQRGKYHERVFSLSGQAEASLGQGKLLLVADILITCMSVVGRYVSFIPDLQQLNLRQLRLFTA